LKIFTSIPFSLFTVYGLFLPKKMRAVVSKRGVDDGNQKGGSSLQPAKENHLYYTKNILNVKINIKKK